MKKNLIFILASLASLTGISQTNLDFEAGNFTGWTGKVGNTSIPGTITTVSTGIITTGINANLYVPSYHTIMTGAGNDPFGPFPRVAPGGNYSVRLGSIGTNVNTCGGPTDICAGGIPEYICPTPIGYSGPTYPPYCGAESIEQSFVVTPANALVTLQYAAVFNNGNHSGASTVNPFFRAEVLNSSGASISSCLTYTFILNSSTLPPGAAQSPITPCWYPTGTNTVVVYMPWQRKLFDLTSQIGQTVTVKFTAGGCDAGEHFGYAYVDASAGPKALIQTGGAGCTGPVTLTGPTQYGGPYSWAGPAGGITAQSANSATVNTTGTYSMTVGSGPCAITFTTAVNLSPPSITAAPSIQTICSGGSVSAVSFSPSAGATVNWTNTNTNVGIAASGSGNIGAYTAPTVTTQQIAYVTATPSVAGCTGPTKVFTITINPYPNLTVGSSPTITCNSPSVPLTGSSSTPGTSYAWSPGGSAPTATTTNVSAAGNYTITASVGSCSTSSVIAVTQNITVPTATAATTSTITCTSTSAILTGTSTTSGATYSWNPGGSAPTGTSTSVSTAGNYTLTVTNPANGCKSTSVVNVTSNTTPPTTTATAMGAISCLAASASTLTGGAPTAATYTWTGPGAISGVNSPTATVTTAGNYTLTVTGTNGCTSSTVTTVTSNTTPPNPTASSPGVITCVTNTVLLTGGPSSLTYTWTGPGFSGGTNGQNAIATATGNYTLAVTGANGCTNTAVTVVGINTAVPSPTAAVAGTITCLTNTVSLNGGAATAVSYTWSGPGLSGSVNSQTATANAGGTYTLAVTAANGCTNTAVITVSPNISNPQLSIGTDVAINCANPTATVTGGSSTPGVTYSWTPAGASPTSSANVVSAGGNYTLTVTGPNGCSTSSVQSVSQNIIVPTVNTSTSNTITCLTTTATAIASTSASPVSYDWAGSGITSATTGSMITVNQGGIYSYTVTNTTNSCVATGTVDIVSDTTIPAASVNNATLTCTSTSAILNGGPLSGVSYSWTGTGITGATNQADATVNATGDYTLTTTAANGCTNTAVATVTDNLTTSVASAGATQTLVCGVTSVTLTGSATPAGNANWLGGVCGSATSFTTTACAPSVYTLEVTNPSSGCVTTATVAVTSSTDVPQATVNAITNSITCTNSVVTIGVTLSNSDPVTYSWTGPGISGTNNTATTTATLSGTYSVTITNSVTTCQSTFNLIVPEDTSPVSAGASPSASITCAVSSVSLSATPTGTNYGYSWAGGVLSGSNTASPTVNAGGDYEVTVTNTINGCTGTYTVTVPTNTIAPSLTLTPSSVTTTCASPNVTLTATSSADPSSTYTWSAPSGGTLSDVNSSNPTAGGSGVFTVAVTNTVSGCISAVETVTVVADANTPTLTALASNTTICSGAAATLTASGTDTYTWSANAGASNSATISVTPTTTTTYSVAGLNTSSGCGNVTNITINVTPTPTVGITSNAASVCEGNSAIITLTGANSYTLTDPATVTTNTVIVTPTTQTTYTVIGETANCASETQTISIGINPLPIIAASNQTNCAGSPVILNASGADTYSWSTSATDNTITVSPANNTTYSVTGTNTLTGCTSTVTEVSVSVTSLPTANASANPNTTCTSGTVNLNASSSSSPSTYTWTTGNGVTTSNQNQPSISFPATGFTAGSYVYSLTVTSPEGCVSAQATTTVNIIDLPNASFDLSDLSICQNSNGSLSINNPQTGVSYDWSIGGTTVNNSNPAGVPGSITGTVGTYTVSVIASIGSCTNSANNTLTVTPLPTVALVNYSVTVCENASAQLDVAGPNSTYNYAWTYGSQTVGSGSNVTLNPLTSGNTGMYTVTATDANGCSNRTAGLIDIKLCETMVPEIFTPNGDGKNDEFYIRNIENYPDNHLKIFNRWGNLVYQKDSYQNEFIGYSNTGDAAGKEKLPSGTYYVILDYGDKKTETYTGYLLLQY